MIAMEMGNVPNTIGSQFLITLSDDNGLKDMVPVDDNKVDMTGEEKVGRYLSLGRVAEDDNDVLSKLNRTYCDDDGRPFADIRIQRVLVIHDPFDDSEEMKELLVARGVELGDGNGELGQDFYALAPKSPVYERPPEEAVPSRIQADDTMLFANEYHDEEEEDEETRQKRLELQQKQEEEWKQRQDTSRAVMLEMLGDLPSAEIKAPENVLFVCKLNPLTSDEDLELIFSRFDQNAKAEIIRDPDTGDSLQYAFVEFTSNEACNEAYLKMNNALVDDRRIKVDFSQSVAKVWDRFNKKMRGVDLGYRDGGRGGGRGRGRGRGRGGMDYRGRGRGDNDYRTRDNAGPNRQPAYNHTSKPEKRHVRSRSNSPNRGRGSDRRFSRSYSPDNGDRHHRDKRSRSLSRSRSRSSSASRRRHAKKHRHHDRHKHHKHHSRKDKKKRKKHHHRHRSRDRYSDDDSRKKSRSRSASPRHRDSHKDDKYSSHRRDERRSKEHRKHRDDRYGRH